MRESIHKTLRCVCVVAIFANVAAHALEAERPSSAETQLHNQVINNALAAAKPTQAAVENFRQRTNAFPSSNAELGISPPAAYATPDIKRINVAANGIIEVTLTANSGVDDGVIVLKPATTHNVDENRIDWTCSSASYATIADATNGVCEYTKVP